MRINQIDISNFKGITKLAFKPKMINIIVGKNNTCKTSLLESIDIMFNYEDVANKYPRHLSSLVNTGAENCDISIIVDGTQKKIGIKHANDIESFLRIKKDLITVFMNTILKRNQNFAVTEEFKGDVDKKFTELIDPELRSNLVKNSIFLLKNGNGLELKYRISVPSQKFSTIVGEICAYLRKKYDLQVDDEELIFSLDYWLFTSSRTNRPTKKKDVVLIKNLLQEIRRISVREKEPESVEKILKIEKILKEHNLIDNLERLDFDFVSFKNGKSAKAIPFDFLGDGFRALVGLLWFVISKKTKDNIILLDEPDAHMHPGYINELVKIIIDFSKNLNTQFFIATHNSDLIDAFLTNSFPNDETEFVKKELTFLIMEKAKDFTVSEFLNYDEAQRTKNELFLDLRGI